MRPLLVMALAAVGFASCGPNKPNIDETQILTQIGFDAPITLTVNANPFYDAWGRPSADAPTIALLSKANYIVVAPETSGPPWVTLEATATNTSDATFSLIAAKRTVKDIIDPKGWSEGSIDYFAETVEYTLDVDARLKAILPAGGTYAIRLVLRNDPAVGAWQLDQGRVERANQLDQRDGSELLSQIAQTGQQYLGDFLEQIRLVRSQAYNKIESDLAANGTLAKSASDDFVLVSKRNGLAYFIKPITAKNFTLLQAEKYCSDLKTKQSFSWRIPSVSEMNRVVDPASHALFDAPDGRLWQAMGAYNKKDAQFITSSICNYPCMSPNNVNYSIYGLPQTVDNPSLVTMSVGEWYYSSNKVIFTNNWQFGLGYSVASGAVLNSVVANANSGIEYGLICVADLNGAPSTTPE